MNSHIPSLSINPKLSRARMSILVISMILLGFILGTQYKMLVKPSNSINQDVAHITPSPLNAYRNPPISAGTDAIFSAPLGWHIAINYLDNDINHEIYYIDPKPSRFNYPSDSKPTVLMNVYTNQQDPYSLYDSLIKSFNETHENITKTEIPQAYFNRFIHVKGIIKAPSVYAGAKSDMYLMISSNPQYTDLTNKNSWNIIKIGPMIDSSDNTIKVIEQLFQSFRECHFEACKKAIE